MKTLLLWDIDGTLIDSGGAGERALKNALQRAFGLTDTLAWLDYFGRTDVWIARAILRHHGFAASSEEISRFLEAYLASVAEEMHNPRARVLPGVREIVEAVSRRSDVAQGLLTGNLQRGARIKLGYFDLWKFFPYGAFADDSELRDDLGPHAIKRAGLHHAVTFAADRVFVIGDTPHDIACGKVVGACTVAVATGRYSAEALRAHTPTHLFGDLADVKGFLGLLDAPEPAAAV